ncbi:TPA: ankyrin repeat domain-containing protein, partial [Campylobacter jejuni]|nr:ankyrin repeat domain-containing protein [Campylobacter jejuni]
PLDKVQGSRNKKLLKDAGAMTSEQLEKKYGIYYKLSDNDDIGKELDEYSKLINDAIKKAKENE